MKPFLIIDTGPIVAGLNRNDPYHGWVSEQLRLPNRGLITCEAVLTESSYFLRKSHEGLIKLLKFIDQSGLQIPLRYSDHSLNIHSLLNKYHDVPMSFADACLVQLSELYPDAPIHPRFGFPNLSSKSE